MTEGKKMLLIFLLPFHFALFRHFLSAWNTGPDLVPGPRTSPKGEASLRNEVGTRLVFG